MRRQLQYDLATTIERYAPKGRPNSASVRGYYSGASGSGSEWIADTAITLDSASQTITGVSRLDTDLTVSDSSDFVAGRRYWVLPTGGTGWEVTCKSVPDSTTVVLDAPIREAVTAGTISSHRLTLNITTTHTESLRRDCRIEWTSVYSTETVRDWELVDVVYWPFDLQISEDDLERRYPGFGELAGDPASWRKLVDGAKEHLDSLLRGKQLKPDLVRDRSLVEEVAIYHVLSSWSRSANQIGDGSLRAQFEKLESEAWDRFLSSHSWYDSNEDMARNVAGQGRIIYIDGEQFYLDADLEDTDETGGIPPSYIGVG